jgi:DNA-directed RNA polymerase specialized sigma24 family protein
MEELEGSARGVSLRAAACMLAGDGRDPAAGERVRRAVDAQLRRAGVDRQDAGDVRTDVVLALLAAPAPDLPLPVELVCARAAVIARNKAIDHGRRRARAPLAAGDDLPEPQAAGARPGSLADGLDEVAALAHQRRVRADLVRALGRLDAPQRAAIAAHAEGGAARDAGLPRSTYYRALAHAQARLRSDLRGRLAGIGVLGDIARAARELFAHAEAAHAAVAAVTATGAVTAAVALSLSGGAAPRILPPLPVHASGGRVQPPPNPSGGVRTQHRSATVTPRARRAATTAPPKASAASLPTSTCTYDPSSYEC